MISIPLLLTPAHECSYLAEQTAQMVFVEPKFALTVEMYSQLIAQGFRRSGDEVYAPHCQYCDQCLPARIAVNQFTATRTQKRCLRKNATTQAVVKNATFNQAHYELYLRYQRSRHAEGLMAQASPEDYLRFMSSTWCQTQFVEFSIADQLAGIAVVDVLHNAFSAVYTFFDPQFADYSLGTYAVLWQIQQAKLQKREFVYLGFWIQACQKMNYKSHYHPLQILQQSQWLAINT